jgi:hypothetical protein
MPKYLVTRETADAMRQLKDAGSTYSEIGRIFALKPCTVRFNLVEGRKTQPPASPERARAILTEALNRI